MLRTGLVDRIYFRVRDWQGRLLGGDAGAVRGRQRRPVQPARTLHAGRQGGAARRVPMPSSRPLFRDLAHAERPIPRSGCTASGANGASLHHRGRETLGKRDEAIDRLVIGARLGRRCC